MSQVCLVTTVLCASLWGFMEFAGPARLRSPLWSRTVLPRLSRVKDWFVGLFVCFVQSPMDWNRVLICLQRTTVQSPNATHRLITKPTQIPLRPSSDCFSDGIAMSNHYKGFSSKPSLSVSVSPSLWTSREQFTDRQRSTNHIVPSTDLGHLACSPLILKKQEGHLTMMSVYMYKHTSISQRQKAQL